MIPRSALRCRRRVFASSSYFSKSSPTQSSAHRQHQPIRQAHTLPSISQHHNEIVQNGVAGLFSPESIQEIWGVYMKYILSKINDRVAGTQHENETIKTLLMRTARDPAKANVFNYASQAHNIHTFMGTINPKDTVPMPSQLEQVLISSFGSIETFQTAFITTALSMFGPGYVWLVLQYNPPGHHPNTNVQGVTVDRGVNKNGTQKPVFNFRILPTYLAGTPYPGAHERLQSTDLNTQNHESVQQMAQQRQPQNSVGSFGSASNLGTSKGTNVRWGGAELMPLMCVSTWEHMYLRDWGIDGKEYYLRAWWDRIDWNIVWQRAGMEARPEVNRQNFLNY